MANRPRKNVVHAVLVHGLFKILKMSYVLKSIHSALFTVPNQNVTLDVQQLDFIVNLAFNLHPIVDK